jgi:hypothetical protein
MSIIIGLTKESNAKDRETIKPIIASLVDSGFVRRILINDEDLVVQTFTEESNEILPAYMVDRITKQIRK